MIKVKITFAAKVVAEVVPTNNIFEYIKRKKFMTFFYIEKYFLLLFCFFFNFTFKLRVTPFGKKYLLYFQFFNFVY